MTILGSLLAEIGKAVLSNSVGKALDGAWQQFSGKPGLSVGRANAPKWSDIEQALDEIIVHEEGIKFQRLATLLAKQRWRELIASEQKWDHGLDAYASASESPDGREKGLACSLTATIAKIRQDLQRIQESKIILDTLIFSTPKKVTNHMVHKWAEEIRNDFRIDLIVIPREEIISSLIEPTNYGLCQTFLGIETPIPWLVNESVDRTQDAVNATISEWQSGIDVPSQHLIDLDTVVLDEKGQDTKTILTRTEICTKLKQAERLVLEGDPGAGKTTTLVQIATDLAAERRLPLLVDLSEWAQDGNSVLSFLEKRPAFKSKKISADSLAEINEAGRLSFLINGWNEISEQNSELAATLMRQLEREFPSAGIIVATRAHHIAPPLIKPHALRLRSPTRSNRREYLQSILGERASELIGRIEGDEALDAITKTPLFLFEIGRIFESGGDLPKTRFGVLERVITRVEALPQHHGHLQAPPLLGASRRYLENLAVAMTEAGGTILPEGAAEPVILSVIQELNQEGRVSPVPTTGSILSILCQHHLLKRSKDATVSYRFTHQQFQEFYAATSLRSRVSAIIETQDAQEVLGFQLDRIDKPIWLESFKFIAEQVADESGNAAAAERAIRVGRHLIEWALPVNPVFAAELCRLCGTAVWQTVRATVGSVLRRWYAVDDEHHRECALTAMFATGSDDFADIIWPLIENDEDQIRWNTLNIRKESLVNSLGRDWKERVSNWTEERRVEILRELDTAGIEDIARNDPSLTVRARALDELFWRRSVESTQDILAGYRTDVLKQILRASRLAVEYSPSLIRQFAPIYKELLGDITDPIKRIRIQLLLHELEDNDAITLLKDELENMPSAQIKEQDQQNTLIKTVVENIRAVDPSWTNQWISENIASGTLWPERWLALVDKVPAAQVEASFSKLASEELSHGETKDLCDLLAVAATAQHGEDVWLKLFEIERVREDRPDAESATQRAVQNQLKTLARRIKASLLVVGLREVSPGHDHLAKLRVILDLLSPRDAAEFDVDDDLPPELRSWIGKFLRDAVETVLAQEDLHGGLKANLALALARFGEVHDLETLKLIIQKDIERVQEGMAAWERGERSGARVNGARMRHSNWYVRAVSRLAPENADALLLDLLEEPEYEEEAGWALVRLLRRPGVKEDISIGWTPNYERAWRARDEAAARESDDQRARYAQAMRDGIASLLEERDASDDPDRLNSRLKRLSVVFSRLADHDDVDQILEILALPGEWDQWNRVDGIDALVLNGAELSANKVLAVLNPVIDHVIAQGVHQDQYGFLLKQCLCLLAFTDDPGQGISRIREIVDAGQIPSYELRDIVVALGQSRSSESAAFLIELAQEDHGRFNAFAFQWLEAMSNLDLPEARRALISFIDPDISEPNLPPLNDYHAKEKLAEILAALSEKDESVKSRILELTGTDPPEPRGELLSQIIEEMDTEAATLAALDLISDDRRPPFSRHLLKAVENALFERIPDPVYPSTVKLLPRPESQIRRRLLDMVLNDASRRNGAFQLLGQIEVWRLDYGKPLHEPWHPDFSTTVPWPPLEFLASASGERTS